VSIHLSPRRSALPHLRVALRGCALVVAAAAVCACQPPLAEPAGAEHFDRAQWIPTSPWEAFAPYNVAPIELEGRERAIFDNMRATHERIFDAVPPDDVLDEIELIFFAAHASFELADYYLASVERAGHGAPMRYRLAWLYQRLGLLTAAEAQARQAVQERPDDPRAHFALGFVLGQTEPSHDDLTEIRDAFARVLELDADFVGPGDASAAFLRSQIAQIDRLRDHRHDP